MTLREDGWAVWIAPDSIQPGEKWVEAINRGLEESGVFVVVLTPDAVASRWVQTETNAAISLEHRDLMRFIPLDHKACDLPLLWGGYQYLPFRRSYEAGLLALLDRLDGKKAAPVRPPTPPRPKPPANRYTHPRTGIELVRIPAGSFLFGSTDEDKDARDNEKPQRKIELPEFWIGLTPVTNDQFSRFVRATGYQRLPKTKVKDMRGQATNGTGSKGQNGGTRWA